MSRSQLTDRRTFVLGLSAGLALPFVPRRAGASTEDLRVLIVGGSAMVGALGKELSDGLQAAGHVTERKSKSASGLARPDFYDWPKVAAEAHAEFRPHATIVMFGGNDGQGLRMPPESDVEWIRWTNEAWSEEYGRRVDAFADAVMPDGEQLFWMGMPAMRQSKLDLRMQRMNAIFEERMAARANGWFIETRSALSDDRGNYVDEMKVDGRLVRVRSPDGIHYSRSGAKVLARHVVPQVVERLGATE
ncbi:SGNH/GDSL hydrolase family protein [Paraliomyxa miuraensis]|uniref:SGNH/GDSL hydrolase family protein n=1 Tax=Paraliomyxa miuraensis TaxID=376150 RepID=UPI0022575C15|nr:DUF459 domain-containing protein [Paraliomyxa miuraensis]MCX4241548.1 DUF459 domain-containing protein [Paraliomyxa miuraensis]